MDHQDHGRRLGERLSPDGDLPVAWRIERTHRRGLRRVDPPTACLVDVSVTGVGLVAPDDHDIGRGSVIGLGFDGAPAVVRIRHRKSIGEDGRCFYGVEFVETDPRIEAWIAELLDGRRSRKLVELWEHSD
ncbi:MAG: hypothetical protein ACOYOP_05930 [Microthrixaceae bacterium]